MKNKAEIREILMNGGEDYETASLVKEATSMVNGGKIRYWWNPEKELVESYGSGPGWCDQGVSEHCLDEIVSYLWKERRYVRKVEEVA